MVIQEQNKKRGDECSALRIHCFGVFRVFRPGEVNPIGMTSKHKMWLLFKYLITNKGTTVRTEEIIELLWPEYRDPTDTSTLRTTISRLKLVLEPDCITYTRSSFIIYQKETCAFNINSPFWLDTEEFKQLCTTAHRLGGIDRTAAIDTYYQAFELYQGDFLSEDLFCDWTTIPRENYRRLLVDSTKEVATWLIEADEYAQARLLLQRTIAFEPYIEELHVLMMRVLLGLKDLKAATEHYNKSTFILYKELGVKPSEEWKELYKKVREPSRNNLNKLILEGRMEACLKDFGPFVCDPHFFWNFLLLERRRLTRNGGEASLVVLELNCLNGKNGDEVNKEAVENLESIICNKLRKSDIICRLDNNHFALLLLVAGYEGSQAAASQVKETFEKCPSGLTYNLQIKVKRVTPS